MTTINTQESATNSDKNFKDDEWASPEQDSMLDNSSLDLISSDDISEQRTNNKKKRFSIVEALEAEVTSSRRRSICFHDPYCAKEGDVLIRSASEISSYNPLDSLYFSPETKKLQNYVTFPGTDQERSKNIVPNRFSTSDRRFTWTCPSVPTLNGGISSNNGIDSDSDIDIDNDNDKVTTEDDQITQICNQLDNDHKLEQEKLYRAAQLLLPLDKERDVSVDIESSLVPRLFSDKRHSMATPSSDENDDCTGENKKERSLFCCPWPSCERVFNRFYNLRSHYRIHSGERPFTCKFCEMSFARNHDLKRHERIHSHRKQFICSRCQKGFSRNDAMSRHIRLNTCKKYNSAFMIPMDDDNDNDINLQTLSPPGTISPPSMGTKYGSG